MSENLDKLYYQPVRDKSANSFAIFVWDTSVFISLAKAAAKSRLDAFEIFPLLAKHGRPNICAERASFEGSRILHGGINAGRLYTQSHARFEDTDKILSSFFQRAVNDDVVHILPAIGNLTQHEIMLANIFSILNRSERLIEGRQVAKGNFKTAQRVIASAEVHRTLRTLNQHKDAGEVSTRNMIENLGSLQCPLVYVSFDVASLKMMSEAGAIAILLPKFLEVLKRMKLLQLIGFDDGHADALIRHVVEYNHRLSFVQAKHEEAFQRSAQTVQKITRALAGIKDAELADRGQAVVAAAPVRASARKQQAMFFGDVASRRGGLNKA